MNREDVRKLLGGYATGTLTPAEQEALFSAALDDQELFDALAAEQPLRDLLSDPAAKANLLANLEPGKARRSWRWAAVVVLAGLAAVAIVTVDRGRETGGLPAARGRGSGDGGRGGDLAVARDAAANPSVTAESRPDGLPAARGRGSGDGGRGGDLAVARDAAANPAVTAESRRGGNLAVARDTAANPGVTAENRPSEAKRGKSGSAAAGSRRSDLAIAKDSAANSEAIAESRPPAASARGRKGDGVGQVEVTTGRRGVVAGSLQAVAPGIGGVPPAAPAITGEPPALSEPSAVAGVRIPAPAVAPPPPPTPATPAPVMAFQERTKIRPEAPDSQAPSEAAVRQQRAQTISVTATAGAVDAVNLRPMPITVLRGDSETPTGTVLNAGETVRLRMTPPEDGTIVVEEGGKVIVNAPVRGSTPYTTPELPFAGSGKRDLQIRFSFSTSRPPLTVPITLTYR